MKKRFFERKIVTLVFSALALVFGFIFLDSNLTGNVITIEKSPVVSLISIIGLLLLVCSVILIAYSAKKR